MNRCPECGGPVEVWADRSGGVTVNFACPNPSCRSGKPPWDTPRPSWRVRQAVYEGRRGSLLSEPDFDDR